MAEWTVRRWTRYGHDRLYAETPGGTALGYLDLKTGRYHSDDVSNLPLLQHALSAHELVSNLSAGPVATVEPAPSVGAGDTSVVVRAQPAASAAAPLAAEWTDLSLNLPGAAVSARAAAERREPLTWLGRILDRLRPRSSWEKGAVGERAVATELAKLGKQWRVLHSVPVGRRGSDIDHVVIGPGGVFTINAKFHPNKSVWVGGEVVIVGGVRQPYVRNSRYEARRAARLLTEQAGFPVAVGGIIAVMGAQRGLTIRDQPADGLVVVVARKEISQRILRQPARLSDREIAAIYEAAQRSTTWS
jgi:hypothetical protein